MSGIFSFCLRLLGSVVLLGRRRSSNPPPLSSPSPSSSPSAAAAAVPLAGSQCCATGVSPAVAGPPSPSTETMTRALNQLLQEQAEAEELEKFSHCLLLSCLSLSIQFVVSHELCLLFLVNRYELMRLKDVFDAISQSRVKDGVIDSDEFADVFQIPHSILVDRFFSRFDENKNRSLDFREFVLVSPFFSTSSSSSSCYLFCTQSSRTQLLSRRLSSFYLCVFVSRRCPLYPTGLQ